MTLRVAIIGSGPAGFAVAAAVLADRSVDVDVAIIDRAELPDGMLRHGPAAGAQRLTTVAQQIDAVLNDSRVSYFGAVEVGRQLALSEVRRSAHAVVLATGATRDLPLRVAGCESVGVGTISHVHGWLCGSADVAIDELDLAMDSAVLIGLSAETIAAAEVLAGNAPDHAVPAAIARLAHTTLRHVQIIDSRPLSELSVPARLPDSVVVRDGLVPVGVVGRNRARALRCTHPPDRHGQVVTEDLRAQLLLRPRASASPWTEFDDNGGQIAHSHNRVRSGGETAVGLYVAGWAGREPSGSGSHAADAAAVVEAIAADRSRLPAPDRELGDVLATNAIAARCLDGWSAVVATEVLLDRFAGEGMAPLADYDALMEQVDED